MSNYEYLNDRIFLKKLDEEPRKEQFIRLSILDFKTEGIIAHIEGVATGGNININGNSSTRRAMSCSLAVLPDGVTIQSMLSLQEQKYVNVTEINNLISLSKKLRVEVGFYNSLAHLGYYPQYDKIWFPLGVFIMKTVSVSENQSGVNMSLNLVDKSALLNGDVGGTIPAATIFSESDIYNPDGSQRVVEPLLIKEIIKQLVSNFGGEKLDNILITDVPDTAIKAVKWTKEPEKAQKPDDDAAADDFVVDETIQPTLYLYKENGYGLRYSIEHKDNVTESFVVNQMIGYMNEPLVYPGTLECAAGDSVASVLDKIKNTLGNYEWFYDLNGRFIFQEIKNYLNTSFSSKITELKEADYLSFMNLSKSVYTFDNKNIVTSISNTPQYGNIKNDFVVWGSKKTLVGIDKPIRYHVAFDNKPDLKYMNAPLFSLVYKNKQDIYQVISLKEGENFEYVNAVGDMKDKEKYYLFVTGNDTSVYHWDERLKTYLKLDKDSWEVCYLTTNDWRTTLYFLGLDNEDKTFANNYYAAELNAEWPKIYNVKAAMAGSMNGYNIYKGAYRTVKNTEAPLLDYDYWLDFLEGADGGSYNLSQYNVSSIGRRSKIVTHNNVNSLVDMGYLDYNIIIADGSTQNEIRTAVNQDSVAQTVLMPKEYYQYCTMNNIQYSAFEKIKELLYIHTQYMETVALSTIPIYYLEPNTRITIEDNDTHVHGDYLIKSISLPLTANGVSNISCSRCVERTF